jgi:Protein of unknown function (DUF3429).
VKKIPNSALILGLSGLIPFFWGAVTSLDFVVENLKLKGLSEEYMGSRINLIYGTIILAFMSGVNMGFCSKCRETKDDQSE